MSVLMDNKVEKLGWKKRINTSAEDNDCKSSDVQVLVYTREHNTYTEVVTETYIGLSLIVTTATYFHDLADPIINTTLAGKDYS